MGTTYDRWGGGGGLKVLRKTIAKPLRVRIAILISHSADGLAFPLSGADRRRALGWGIGRKGRLQDWRAPFATPGHIQTLRCQELCAEELTATQ